MDLSLTHTIPHHTFYHEARKLEQKNSEEGLQDEIFFAVSGRGEDAEIEPWRGVTEDFGKKSHRWHGLQIYVPAAREVFIYDGRYREDGDEEPGQEG